MNTVLKVTNLGIRRSERWLFKELSFSVNSGEVVQVVGLNGSGKTSLLRALCGLLYIAEGELTWGSDEYPVWPIFQGHLSAVKPELTVFENLKYHPLQGKLIDDESIEKAIVEVNLIGYEDEVARKLSAGQTRRVGLARLLLSDTKCWVLDEPFTSIDVDGCRWLEQQIEKFRSAGNSVIITSHQPLNMQSELKIVDLGLHIQKSNSARYENQQEVQN